MSRTLGSRRPKSEPESRVLLAVLLAMLLVPACSGNLPPVPAPAPPHYPDFVAPTLPQALGADQAAALRHDRGWRFLQANDLRNAEREFAAALKKNPKFFPSDTGLGYVALAQKDYKGALARFELALRQSAGYGPALVGRGDSLLGLGRRLDALKSFEAAVAADPSLTIAAQRVQVLRLGVSQSDINSARQAADAGRLDEARQAYQRAIAASPESAFLYRDLGAVERKRGDSPAALEAFRKAVAMDPRDARSLEQIGELLEAQGDYDGALQAYGQAAAIEPTDALSAQIERVRERASIARMPPEFRDIPQSARLTRGELAALIGVHFAGLLESPSTRESVVITDTRGHWAAAWILAVVRAGIMEVNANHTFQPRSAVRRVDLARAMSRLLNVAAQSSPALAARWRGGPAQAASRPAIADVPAGHLSYPAAAQVVSAGIMPLFEDGTFRPGVVVSGEETLQVIERAEALIGGRAAQSGRAGEPKR